MKKQIYITFANLSLEDVIPNLGGRDDKRRHTFIVGDKEFKPKVASVRLQTFHEHGTDCHYCGVKGTHFQLEQDQVSYKNYGLRPHLNLYAGDVLMTHDHVIPKSANGKDDVSNTVTACSKCNDNKGSASYADFLDVMKDTSGFHKTKI